MFWRRRFYKSPITSVPAGGKRCLIRHKGKINVRQLCVNYDANDTTGSNQCILTIIIDGEQILNDSFLNIHQHFSGYRVTIDSAVPVATLNFDNSAKFYTLRFLDLGTVKENIEVWLENVDTSNLIWTKAGMVYDIYEEKE